MLDGKFYVMCILAQFKNGGRVLLSLPKPKNTVFSRFVKGSSYGLELIYSTSKCDKFRLKS